MSIGSMAPDVRGELKFVKLTTSVECCGVERDLLILGT